MAKERTLVWPFGAKCEPRLVEKPLALLGCSRVAANGVEPETILWDEGRRCFAFRWPRLLSGLSNRVYYLEALLEFAPWDEVQRKNGDVLRHTCWYVRGNCKCDYTYGSERVAKVHSRNADFHSLMDDLTERVFTHCLSPALHPDVWPNCANLNLYEDDSQGVGWHADDESLFMGKTHDCPIVSLSLGAPREFWLAAKSESDPARPDMQSIVEIDLADGDLLTMEGLCQKHCIHQVPPNGSRNRGHRCPESRGHGYSEATASASEILRVNITWRWVRSHKQKCPLWWGGPGGAPVFATLEPAKPVPGAGTAMFWASGRPLQWRKRCGSHCGFRTPRNCVEHHGQWICRRCWVQSRDRRREDERPHRPSLADAPAEQDRPETARGSVRPGKAPAASTLPAPRGHGRLGRALRDFDGFPFGRKCLTVVKGMNLARLPSREGRDGWVWGGVLASSGGWFPDALLGPDLLTPSLGTRPAPGAAGTSDGTSGAGAPRDEGRAAPGSEVVVLEYGRALGDFDGALYGADYMTFVRGSALVRLEHPRSGHGWSFGAHLVSALGWFPLLLFSDAGADLK